jgi:hypothetical protein
MLWELIPGSRDVCEMRQILMHPKDGDTIPIPLPSCINSSEKLKQHLKKYSLENADPVCLSVPTEEWDDVVSMIREVWPKKRASNIQHGESKTKVRLAVKITVTSLYFRAVAKIGFHYFLSVYSSQFSGAEPEFMPIRSFIMNGEGQPEDFVRQTQDQLVYPLGRGHAAKTWGHFLTAEKHEQNITCRVQFFVGPKNLPPVLVIGVGPNPHRIIHQQSIGHFYSYFSNGPNGGYDGEVSQMSSLNSIYVPSRLRIQH